MSRWFEQLVDFGGTQRNLRWIVGLLLVLLLALAALQYYWIGELSDAKRTEMQQALRTTTGRFVAEFNREFGRVYMAFLGVGRLGPDVFSKERLAERFQQWQSTAPHHRLVKRVFVVKLAADAAEMLNPDTDQFERASLPPEILPAVEQLRRAAERGRGGGSGPGGLATGGGPPGLRGIMGIAGSESHPVLASPRFERPNEGAPPVIAGWALAEIDVDYLQSELLPEMANRYFGENYQVRIAHRESPGKTIFQSSHSADFSRPDQEAFLFDINPQDFGRSGGGAGGPGRRLGGRRGGSDKGAGAPPALSGYFGPGPGGLPPPQQARWLLQAKHKAGSLDAAVQDLRYKNLAISTFVLLLMGLSIGAFVSSTRRAQQLAQQQMEFVASISHELRTPLTVICSAGDNLAGGVVKNEAQLKRYGNLIRSEGNRLADMVEQILGYAGIQKGRLPDPKPVDVAGIVESALRACAQTLAARGCTVEQHISSGLPMISGDAASLSHCVQNLLTNAAKYGGGWVSITAEQGLDGKVRITVEDHGPGIEQQELRHIFEPFYRGKKALDDQIHGTGLGLSLVKRIIEAHSGRVSVESTVGRGSRFTLELPASARPKEEPVTAPAV